MIPHSETATALGGGKIQSGQGPNLATASQRASSKRVHPIRRKPWEGAAVCAAPATGKPGSVAAVIAQLLPQGALRLGGEHLLDPPGEARHRGVLDLARPRDVDGQDAQDPAGPGLHERDAGPED